MKKAKEKCITPVGRIEWMIRKIIPWKKVYQEFDIMFDGWWREYQPYVQRQYQRMTQRHKERGLPAVSESGDEWTATSRGYFYQNFKTLIDGRLGELISRAAKHMHKTFVDDKYLESLHDIPVDALSATFLFPVHALMEAIGADELSASQAKVLANFDLINRRYVQMSGKKISPKRQTLYQEMQKILLEQEELGAQPNEAQASRVMAKRHRWGEA